MSRALMTVTELQCGCQSGGGESVTARSQRLSAAAAAAAEHLPSCYHTAALSHTHTHTLGL